MEQRYCLFSKQVNGCQGDGFSSMGTQTVTITLHWMVATYTLHNMLLYEKEIAMASVVKYDVINEVDN